MLHIEAGVLSYLEDRNKLVREAISCERIGTVKRNTLNKFMDDKAFYTDEKYIIVLDCGKHLLIQYHFLYLKHKIPAYLSPLLQMRNIF